LRTQNYELETKVKKLETGNIN